MSATWLEVNHYPTEPLDKIAALQAEFELAEKKNLGKLAGWEI